MFNSSLVHVLETFFWTGELLDKLRLKDWLLLMDLFLTPIHMSCRSRDVVFTMMLFGCARVICELKGI